MKNVIAALLCAAVLISCKKKTTDNTDITIVNRIDKSVTVSIYPTMDDYNNATNVVVRKVVGASSNEIIPGNTLTAGKTYYMDWHTDNYYQTNWFNDKYPQSGSQVAITPVPGNNTYYTEPSFTGNARTVYLAKNGTSSKWLAVNAYMFSSRTGYVSFWSNLSANERYHEITIHKNFIADYSHKNSAGTTVTDYISFKVMRTEDAFIEFKASGDSSLGQMISGTLPTAAPPTYKSNSKDTVMALLPNSEYYFMMVRQ
ncbi:MAG TPA: hypothetical protein VK167_12275 [Flavipsychrobacter sp.]|nr:hypothetical protein [Flavipsychrobacter sp.]